MQTREKGDKSKDEQGQYILVKGRRWNLSHHPTDFAVDRKPTAFKKMPLASKYAGARQLSAETTRVSAVTSESRDKLIDEVRATPGETLEQKTPARHIYTHDETGEEIIPTDRIFLVLHDDSAAKAEAIRQAFNLADGGRSGRAFIFKVTEDVGKNPIKVANEIAAAYPQEVEASTPELLFPLQSAQLCAAGAPDTATLTDHYKLFDRQWYLSKASAQAGADEDASLDVTKAWTKLGSMGKPEIVIAVIDDGFDIGPTTNPLNGHPVFRNKRIDPHKFDFQKQNDDPISDSQDTHGTIVASLATASPDGGGMLGVAPCCAFLPLAIGLGPAFTLQMFLDALNRASAHADVVNCSIVMPLSSERSIDTHPDFERQVKDLIASGGRRPGQKGLVIVFAAGNDDAPTFLAANDNQNGVRFVRPTGPATVAAEIPPGKEVHSGFPEIEGVIAVGAMSSLRRKAGYSNWGEHITVVAPSGNGHQIKETTGLDPVFRSPFVVDYPGLAVVAAINRTGSHGSHHSPAHLGIAGFEDYAETPGKTSAAAALVSGVAALILSANPDLKAAQVKAILQETADHDTDEKKYFDAQELDLSDDPNLQGLGSTLADGRSRYFGSGKVNAARAVEKVLNPDQ